MKSRYSSQLLKLSVAGALSALTFSQAFAAAEVAKPDMSIYDSNKDGVVSKDEFMASGGSEKGFTTYDLNGDGGLDKGEFAKVKPEHEGPAMPAMPPRS